MEVYETLPVIARIMGKHPETIRNWIKKEGFPAAKTPKGNIITTSSLIDQWILARQDVDQARQIRRQVNTSES